MRLALPRRLEADVSDWIEMRTQRLLLRGWTDNDRERFAALNADPCVMEFLGKPLTREQSDAFVDRIKLKYARHGFGLWAVEVVDVAPFIGFVGLNVPTSTRHSCLLSRSAGDWIQRFGDAAMPRRRLARCWSTASAAPDSTRSSRSRRRETCGPSA